jgi:hypothetical protein
MGSFNIYLSDTWFTHVSPSSFTLVASICLAPSQTVNGIAQNVATKGLQNDRAAEGGGATVDVLELVEYITVSRVFM